METASLTPRLDEKTRAALHRVLEAHPEIRLALVFGSLVQGKADWESDLDLAVDAGKPLTPTQRIALVDELAQALGRAVKSSYCCAVATNPPSSRTFNAPSRWQWNCRRQTPC